MQSLAISKASHVRYTWDCEGKFTIFLSSSTIQVGEDGSDTDWNMTVRLPEGLPEDFDYSEPVNVVDGEKMRMTMIVMMMMMMMMMTITFAAS